MSLIWEDTKGTDPDPSIGYAIALLAVVMLIAELWIRGVEAAAVLLILFIGLAALVGGVVVAMRRGR